MERKRPPSIGEIEPTRRWERPQAESETLVVPRAAIVAPRAETADPVTALRSAIAAVKIAPRDPDARQAIRRVAEDPDLREPLALLVADEARAAKSDDVGAALFEELADVYESLDQPLDAIAAMEGVIARGGSAEHHDRLAWMYRRAGAWAKAAAQFSAVGELVGNGRGHAALRAAAQLYREHGVLDRAADIYRAIVERKPADAQAWRELDDVSTTLGRWSEVAEIRGERAARAPSGVERAALLRSQARALEQAGQVEAAARVVGESTAHAPDDLSGLVDHADVLARAGRAEQAADLLRARIREAIERGADSDHVAALRLRVVGIVDDAGDRIAAAAALGELLAAAPEYVPALERAAAFAATDPDPRAHATALVRYAAALPRVDGALFAAAARRFRDAGDHEAAVRILEDVIDVDDTVATELEDARVAMIVDRARAARDGDLAGAERKLRAVLAQRFSLDAHLALVDLLTIAGRFDDAAAHLNAALAGDVHPLARAGSHRDDGIAPRTREAIRLEGSAPASRVADIPAPARAALVHRLALIEQALDHDDEAHRLLHEAHRLDRRALPITLDLGESCFRRRLWREAARLLGSLPEHPDARRHASAVAHALVHAAAAEARSLRPANALAHLEAAVQIDAGCAAAWHGLAQHVIDGGDLVRGADYLEREAAATKEPRERIRLFDALGDMACDVLGDPARAERCWSEVTDIADATVLGKLLALQRKRGAARERARTCLRLAELDADRKAMLEEAAPLLAAAGELPRALEIAQQLVSSHPLDLDSVTCATDIALAAGDHRHAAVWLRRALGAQTADTIVARDRRSAALRPRGTPAGRARAADAGDNDARAPLGDDARAAALWRKLGDAERVLGDLAAARRAYQQATVIAPMSDGALAARRGLVELSSARSATSPFALQSSLFALIEAEPEAADALALARELVDDDPDHARAAFELARALGATLATDDQQFFAGHPPRAMAADEGYVSRLDEATRRELIDDAGDAPLCEVLALLGDVAPRILSDARATLLDAGLFDAERIPVTGDSAAAAILPQIAKALEGPPTLLYASARLESDVLLLAATPPVIVVGPRLHGAGDTALRFELGRMVELSRWPRVLAGMSRDDFAALVNALVAFGHPNASPAATRDAERLRAKLPVTHRKLLAERIAMLSPDTLDPDAYLAACQRAADRAGLLACGDIEVAIDRAGGASAAPHLVQLAGSRSYLAARRKLRARQLDDITSPFSR